MAIIKIPYRYKNYPDCPKATKVDKFLHNPGAAMFTSIFLCFAVILVGAGFYNLNRDNAILTGIGTVFFILSFVILFGGAYLIPWLADKLHIADRVYEKETGKKIY